MEISSQHARRQMLVQQLRCAEILDPLVIDVLDRLPRERFIETAYKGLAYADTELPLAHGQSMLTPLMEGRILQALQLEPDDRILEIGTGSGHLTACLAGLGAQVTSIDIFPDLVDEARARLDELGIVNCELQPGDAFEMEPGRFDAIAVTGSIPRWDSRFEDWLRPGGRLFVVVGSQPIMQAWLVRRGEDEKQRRRLFETVIPPLLNADRGDTFAF